MITGWNEWWAGRWDNTLPGNRNPAQGQTIANTFVVEETDPKRCNYFVDNLNGEYSRDIEASENTRAQETFDLLQIKLALIFMQVRINGKT